jgi:hypothetical protein
LAELARERLSKARALLDGKIITAAEYVDVIDEMRKEIGLDPLPEANRLEAIDRAGRGMFG